MNLYIRYFSHEALVHSVDEALSFLSSLSEITLTDDIEADVRAYMSSDIRFPKRYKVRPRAYFILIKTTANSMEEFKQKHSSPAQEIAAAHQTRNPNDKASSLREVQEGWYEGHLDFKRMVQKPQTGKYEYRDTHVEYQCKALSGLDCYNRIVDYLKTKVNHRSQFPSAKGNSFKFKYLGRCK